MQHASCVTPICVVAPTRTMQRMQTGREPFVPSEATSVRACGGATSCSEHPRGAVGTPPLTQHYLLDRS